MPNEDAKRKTEQSRARLNVKERGMLQNFTKAVRELQLTFRDVFSPYRPELCYMRGPGPACRARSSGIPGSRMPSQVFRQRRRNSEMIMQPAMSAARRVLVSLYSSPRP